jgi:hypothetical protein
MQQALAEAAAAGIDVYEMSPSAPVPLFVAPHVIFYKPSGCALLDADQIRRGLASIRSLADAPPTSKIFPAGETPSESAG